MLMTAMMTTTIKLHGSVTCRAARVTTTRRGATASQRLRPTAVPAEAADPPEYERPDLASGLNWHKEIEHDGDFQRRDDNEALLAPF